MFSRRLCLRKESMRLAVLCLLVSTMLPSVSLAQDQVPVFKVTPEQSDVKFFVKASVAIDGKFKKWDATLTFRVPRRRVGRDSTSKFMQTPLTPEAA